MAGTFGTSAVGVASLSVAVVTSIVTAGVTSNATGGVTSIATDGAASFSSPGVTLLSITGVTSLTSAGVASFATSTLGFTLASADLAVLAAFVDAVLPFVFVDVAVFLTLALTALRCGFKTGCGVPPTLREPWAFEHRT